MASSPIRVVVLGVRQSSGEADASSAPELVARSAFFLDSAEPMSAAPSMLAAPSTPETAA